MRVADATLLSGAPLSTKSADMLTNKAKQSLIAATNKLCNIDRHGALTLLRRPIDHVRIVYAMRSSPCFESSELNSYDNELKSITERILNIQISDREWKQASLPASLSGLSIRTPRDLAVSAFICGVRSCERLVSTIVPGAGTDLAFNDAVTIWQQHSGLMDMPTSFNMKDWDRPVAHARARELLATALGERDIARLNSVRSPEASSLLSTLPSSKDRTRLSDEGLRIFTSMRLGCDMGQDCVCKCGQRLDPLGDHALSCKKGGARQALHTDSTKGWPPLSETPPVPWNWNPQVSVRRPEKGPTVPRCSLSSADCHWRGM